MAPVFYCCTPGNYYLQRERPDLTLSMYCDFLSEYIADVI